MQVYNVQGCCNNNNNNNNNKNTSTVNEQTSGTPKWKTESKSMATSQTMTGNQNRDLITFGMAS